MPERTTPGEEKTLAVRTDRGDIEDYLRGLALRRETAVLAELRRRTAELPEAVMQISPEQGALLSLLVRLTAANLVLEVGVFTGYSSISLASALPEDGLLVACDVSREWTDIAGEFWGSAGVEDRVDLRLGPASRTLEELIEQGMDGRFDLAFIDADKSSYCEYFGLCRRLVRSGGLIVLDNAFMGGRVADSEPDGAAAVVAALTDAIYEDPGLEPVLLPLGDGVLVVRLTEQPR